MVESDAGAVAAAVRAEREEAGGAAASPVPGKRARGRPKGSKTRSKTGSSPREAKEEREPYKATEQSVAGTAVVVATLWKIAGPMVKLSALTADEARELARALDPILYKYVPLLDEWKEEFNLAVALAGAFQITRERYKEEHPEHFIKRAKVGRDADFADDFDQEGNPRAREADASLLP